MSGGGGGRGKRQIEEEHENHERWLVSYADMITVLMALFIVLYAMSQVDEEKFLELRQSLAAGFGSQVDLNGSPNVMTGQGVAPMAAIAPSIVESANGGARGRTVRPELAPTDPVSEAMAAQRRRQFAEAKAEAERLQRIADEVNAVLRSRKLLSDVRVVIDDRGLVISLVSEHVVFAADLATLTPRGARVVDTLAPVLTDLADDLQIDGHTNQVDVQPKYYPTDWDLSAARAITVLRRLNEVGGVPEERLKASAYGHERPLVDPAEPGSQRVNKRVDIIVESALPAETRALLPQASAAGRTPTRTTDPVPTKEAP